MSKLAEIVAHKAREVIRAKAQRPLHVLEGLAEAAGAPRGFAQALRDARDEGRYGLICEIKKASPSKGLIRADFDPPALARAYHTGGAACLSVLTDERYFQGRSDYLTAVREAVPLPVLRKDFMLEPYQITESRALGADCVLIILACLSDARARELADCAEGLGMDVLVEVHDAAELDRALALNADMIGINNRNLKTMEVDINTSLELKSEISDDRLVVAESGLSTPEDLAKLADAGITTFLIGEALMRPDDVAAATRHLAQRG